MEIIKKYIYKNTSNKINKKRRLINKYSFKLRIISLFLASSNLYGFVILPDKVELNNYYPITIESNDTARKYRDNLSTLPNDSNDDIIKRWSDVFELKNDIIRDIIYKKTNNLSDEDELIKYYKKYKEDHNFTRAIICFIRDIYSNPSKYGYSLKELKNNKDFKTVLNPEEQVVVLSEIFNTNPYLIEAIMICEWGHPGRRNNNTYNVFGWNGASKTPNRTVSMIYAISGLNTNYGITKKSGVKQIDSIASKYCPANTDKWKNVVKYNYGILKNKGMFYEYKNKNNLAFINYKYNDYVKNDYHIKSYVESIQPKNNILDYDFFSN